MIILICEIQPDTRKISVEADAEATWDVLYSGSGQVGLNLVVTVPCK
jgi:hypothetical protein